MIGEEFCDGFGICRKERHHGKAELPMNFYCRRLYIIFISFHFRREKKRNKRTGEGEAVRSRKRRGRKVS